MKEPSQEEWKAIREEWQSSSKDGHLVQRFFARFMLYLIDWIDRAEGRTDTRATPTAAPSVFSTKNDSSSGYPPPGGSSYEASSYSSSNTSSSNSDSNWDGSANYYGNGDSQDIGGADSWYSPSTVTREPW